MSKLYTADKFVTIGGTTAQYVTGTGSLVTFPAIPSGADYIQNQIASAQSANMWISGSAYVGATNLFSSGIIRQDISGTTFNQLWYSGSSVGTVNTDGLNISYNATSALTFGTGGTTERMRITGAGNVGIGTSSPTAKLHVEGNATPGNYAAYINNASGGGNVLKLYNHDWDVADYLLYATNGGGYSFVVDGNGKVGIGTTSPSEKLHVVGDVLISDSSPSLIFTDTTNNADAIIYTLDDGSLAFSADENNEVAGSKLLFYVDGGEKVRITDGGNVGIGTSSPSSMLTLNGTTPYIRIERSGVNTWQIQNNYLSVQNGFSVNNITAGTTPFFIGENGNVGIGTTSPGAKLDVNGDALINQLTIGQGPVVGQGNTALGKGALGSMVGGKSNIAVGSNANSDNDVTGLTVIGVDLNVNPAGSALTQNSLVIGQYNALNYSTQYPHIYAPDKVNCPNGDTTTDVIAVDYSVYTAIFMEYSIFNSAGDQFRAGTYTVAFKGTGTPVDDDKQTVVYSGTTLSATFNVSLSLAGSIATIQLRNQDSDTYDIRVTARLLMR